MDDSDITTTLKIIVLGESGVGKSCLVVRFLDDSFNENQTFTVGILFRSKVITVNNQKFKLSIWDTAGQERFKSIQPNFYRDSHGVILIYDVTNKNSFNEIESWIETFDFYSFKPDAIKMIVGNKIDLNGRTVTKEQGMMLAKKYKALFLESSAKTGSEVNHIFEELVKKIIQTPGLCKSDHDRICLTDSNDNKGSQNLFSNILNSALSRCSMI